MSLSLVKRAPVEQCHPVVDFCVTMACLPTTVTFLALDVWLTLLGAKSRGQRAIVSGERYWGGRTIIQAKFRKG